MIYKEAVEYVAKLNAMALELAEKMAPQMELVGGMKIRWAPAIDAEPPYLLAVEGLKVMRGDQLRDPPEEFIARYFEVRAALLAWSTDGGEWPLARHPKEGDAGAVAAVAAVDVIA